MVQIKAIDNNGLIPHAVTLSDCLVCSGCATSSEEVLVASHSAEILFNATKDPLKVCMELGRAFGCVSAYFF